MTSLAAEVSVSVAGTSCLSIPVPQRAFTMTSTLLCELSVRNAETASSHTVTHGKTSLMWANRTKCPKK